METALLIKLAEIFLTAGPIVAQGFQKVFAKKQQTDADWNALWSIPEVRDYDFYVRSKPPPPMI